MKCTDISLIKLLKDDHQVCRNSSGCSSNFHSFKKKVYTQFSTFFDRGVGVICFSYACRLSQAHTHKTTKMSNRRNQP